MNQTRRDFLKLTTASGIGICVGRSTPASAQLPRDAVDPDYKVKNGRIQQSIMGW